MRTDTDWEGSIRSVVVMFIFTTAFGKGDVN